EPNARRGVDAPVLSVPVDESLDVQRDRPGGYPVADRDVVARRDPRAAVAAGHPVLVDPHPHEPFRRPERVDVALAVADRPVARMEPAPVVPPVLIRAVERLAVPRIQVDAVDLHERTLDLPGDVRDRARRAEGPLERNPARAASRVAPRPVG